MLVGTKRPFRFLHGFHQSQVPTSSSSFPPTTSFEALAEEAASSPGRGQYDVPSSQTTNNSSSGNGGVANRNHILQLGLEDTVEVLTRTDGDESIGVGEGREDSDSVFHADRISKAFFFSMGGIRRGRELRAHDAQTRAFSFSGANLLVRILELRSDGHDFFLRRLILRSNNICRDFCSVK